MADFWSETSAWLWQWVYLVMAAVPVVWALFMLMRLDALKSEIRGLRVSLDYMRENRICDVCRARIYRQQGARLPENMAPPSSPPDDNSAVIQLARELRCLSAADWPGQIGTSAPLSEEAKWKIWDLARLTTEQDYRWMAAKFPGTQRPRSATAVPFAANDELVESRDRLETLTTRCPIDQARLDCLLWIIAERQRNPLPSDQ